MGRFIRINNDKTDKRDIDDGEERRSASLNGMRGGVSGSGSSDRKTQLIRNAERYHRNGDHDRGDGIRPTGQTDPVRTITGGVRPHDAFMEQRKNTKPPLVTTVVRTLQ